MRSTVVTVVLLVLAAGIVTACGESKADKAKNQVCDARADIAKQVDSLKSLTITTATTEKISDSLKAIQADLKKIADASGDLSAERKKDVQAANDEFKSTMSEITADFGSKLSIQDLVSQGRAALQQLATSYANTFGKLSC
jgi:conjugal transfer/entry exclusion protein